jgi:ATP-dependent exoDNAse (exonuclease V) alpha subunit
MSKLTPKQKKLFDDLHFDRLEDYKVFSKKDYGGLFRSVIDKYPDPVHFVYELLQNADDANATEVYIILKHDRLIFKHNGTKHFDVTPLNADEVGDINSITGIGNSSKKDNIIETQNKIGKFGVGFKSVFQYTDTPEIYDDTFCFKIENFIIPTLIEENEPGRENGETMFVFRFPSKKQKQAHKEILEKLEKLQNPLLFLQHLQKITWRIDSSNNQNGKEFSYEKRRIEHHNYDKITLERYHLTEPDNISSLFLFSRIISIPNEEGMTKKYPIHIGFYYDEEKKRLITSNCNRKIYCFFPTKDSLRTCFISHAPFLLTDNRQNIKQNEPINKKLVNLLAELAAKSIVILRDYGKHNKSLLIDENITQIIPHYNKEYFSNYNELFEQPIIDAFSDMMEREPLLLSKNNKYILPEQAFTTRKGIYELLNSEQLQKLRKENGIEFLKWEVSQVITSRQKKEEENSFNSINIFDDVRDYEIIDFGHDITADFMDSMNFEWVIKFYNFLPEHASIHLNITNQSKGGELVFRNAPIIKTQRNEWVRPFNNNTEPNVYLPIEEVNNTNDEYNFVNEKYLKNKSAKKLFELLDFKKPNEHDYIRNIILEKYNGDEVEIDDDIIRKDFVVLLNHYKNVNGTNEEDVFFNMTKEFLLLVGTDNHLHKPSELLLKNSIWEQYFDGNKNISFFDHLFYQKATRDSFKTSFINDFLIKIGINTKPTLIDINSVYSPMIPYEIKNHLPQHKKDYYNYVDVDDKELIGFKKACQSQNITLEISVSLWNDVLNEILRSNSEYHIKTAIIHASTKTRKTSDDYYKETRFVQYLKTFPWIYDKDGNINKSADIYIEDLYPGYNLPSKLPELLGIAKRTYSLQDKYDGVTDEDQAIFEIGNIINQANAGELSNEEIRQAIEDKKCEKRAEKAREQQKTEQASKAQDHFNPNIEQTQNVQAKESVEDRLKKMVEEKKNRFVGKPHSNTNNGGELSIDSFNSTPQSPQNNAPFFVPTTATANTTIEKTDDTAHAEKSLKAKNTKAKEQAEISEEQVEYLELLNQTEKYTFKWFKILMLLMHAGQDKITERRVQIDFSKYELICSEKILHLTEPTTPVPQWISDAEKYSITTLANGKTAKIDGLIVKTEDNSVDISIEVTDRMLSDLQQSKKIRIIAIDNTNIIDSLETRFLQLEKDDDFDMNTNLPTNLSFIYGPPGTGKTTELVKQVREILEKEPKSKILVLTPTNKAADVVAVKMSNDDVCESGLARYGATDSLYLIEEIGCVTNRETTDLKNWHNIVVATTARYAYDFVQPDDTPICDYPWDYIFIDEASMVDILTITYILHKGASAKKIIISGDPKQIQPVTQNDMPAFNIYDMVNLHGFSEAIYNYDRFDVKGLTMQHRSIPVIGNLVSAFAYDGLVDYDPNRSPMKPLTLDGLQIRNINFLGFDVAELDDIKGLNSINNSAFNLYSVIFTYNMVEYTIKQIEKQYPNKDYSIGIVCAYRAQADAIKNMLENRPLETAYCKVNSGTVHSFQGDECDIMFIVLNPPAVCTSGTHVNNENIINVAMSRARDYIFFIVPNGQQKGFYMKNRIGAVLPFTDRAILRCPDIEKLMFQGNDNFIYENTHVTCHMPVNVYCKNNALYEVRMSDNALDIMINEK